MPSRTFSADTLPPPEGSLENEPGRREKIIKLSRERYGKPRELVEDKIQRWSKNTGKLDEDEKPALKKPKKNNNDKKEDKPKKEETPKNSNDKKGAPKKKQSGSKKK